MPAIEKAIGQVIEVGIGRVTVPVIEAGIGQATAAEIVPAAQGTARAGQAIVAVERGTVRVGPLTVRLVEPATAVARAQARGKPEDSTASAAAAPRGKPAAVVRPADPAPAPAVAVAAVAAVGAAGGADGIRPPSDADQFDEIEGARDVSDQA